MTCIAGIVDELRIHMGQDLTKRVDHSSEMEQGTQQIFFITDHLRRVRMNIICILPFFKFFFTPLIVDADTEYRRYKMYLMRSSPRSIAPKSSFAQLFHTKMTQHSCAMGEINLHMM